MSIERLTSAARAAGFAMATPEDLDAAPAPRRTEIGWRSALPPVVERPSPPAVKAEARGNALRDWFAMLSFRAPA